jgi:hypothetical protein
MIMIKYVDSVVYLLNAENLFKGWRVIKTKDSDMFEMHVLSKVSDFLLFNVT